MGGGGGRGSKARAFTSGSVGARRRTSERGMRNYEAQPLMSGMRQRSGDINVNTCRGFRKEREEKVGFQPTSLIYTAKKTNGAVDAGGEWKRKSPCKRISGRDPRLFVCSDSVRYGK